MSAIKTFQDCRRRYYYDYVMKLAPKVNRASMQAGTDIHDLLEFGYSHWALDKGETFLPRVAAYHIDKWGDQTENPEKWLLFEIVEYYWTNVGQYDSFDEIVLVEEPMHVNVKGWDIRGTFDLLVRTPALELWDHKTVATIDDEINFMPLDFQLRMYSLMAVMLYGEQPKLLHNVIRRDVPREFTATGRKSTANKDLSAFHRRPAVFYSKDAMTAFKAELRYWLAEMDRAHKTREFGRSPRKGPMGCGGCVYRSICEGEFSGRPLDLNNVGVKMSFNIKQHHLDKT